jgi:hypothetical protein
VNVSLSNESIRNLETFLDKEDRFLRTEALGLPLDFVHGPSNTRTKGWIPTEKDASLYVVGEARHAIELFHLDNVPKKSFKLVRIAQVQQILDERFKAGPSLVKLQYRLG